jgi:predicted ATPase/class 3 adenylate cyclase
VTDRVLPTGTLTFLFTDLEGSTRLLHDLGDEAYGELLEAHRRLLRAAFAARDGVEFGTGGDALFVVFPSAAQAVAAAVDGQRELAGHAWPVGAPVRVRMALHTGEPRVVDGDYVGVPLHVVARLCSAAHGGQVLMSDATRVLAGHRDVDDLGAHRLRDVPEPVAIFQLVADGLARDFPPPRTLSALPNNLPVPTDRLFGRELDVIAVADALDETRLLTLVGPGGAGKTRLSLDAAAALLPAFPDGVWFVALSAATTADQVAALTAHVLHVGERGAQSLTETLCAHLASKRVLLVLDNCEQLVVPVAAFVDDVLRNCPDVRVVATSRELLGVPGERVIAVAPLPIGDAAHPGEAVRMFVERAAGGVAGFDAAAADLDLVAEVCRRLDGLPLAIELAAARLRSMSLRQIVDRLDDRFHLLTGGARTAERRQQTLEAVVAWSYDLLDETERAVHRRLAVFADSFDLAAAETVAAWGDVARVAVSDAIAALVDKSLVVPLRDGEEYRYRLLETLRQYGRDQLDQCGEMDEARAHLRRWAGSMIDELAANLRTPRQDAALRAATRERENLRAVYEDARDQGAHEVALRIVTFAPIMRVRDRAIAIDELLRAAPDAPADLQGHALTATAQFLFACGDPVEGLAAAERAAVIFETLGDRRFAAWARYFQVFNAWELRADAEVGAAVRRLIDDFRALGEPLGLAYMFWVASQLEPDLDLALEHAARSEEGFRELDSPFGLAHLLEGRALIEVRRERPYAALPYADEALALLSGPEEPGCTAHVIEAVATVLSRIDRRDEAARLLGAADTLRRTSGHSHRPWELRARDLAEEELRGTPFDDARAVGRGLGLDEAVAYARAVLGDAAGEPGLRSAP